MAEAYPSHSRRPDGASPRRGNTGGGRPAQDRELRAQGRRTMARLLDAGLRVFAERGFHAARVDDVVRAARTSHGTFYLYFENKDDLLRALAVECARELDALTGELGAVGPDEQGYEELRRFLAAFFTTYARYGPVIRAWMEGSVVDRQVNDLGVQTFTDIATALGTRMRGAGAKGDDASIAALMAMLERYAYFRASRRLAVDDAGALDTLARMVHRGFFEAPFSAA